MSRKNRIPPSPKTSVARPTWSDQPLACSGEIVGRSADLSSGAFGSTDHGRDHATPKSITRGCPSPIDEHVSRIKSWWVMPCSWAICTARAMAATVRAAQVGSGGRSLTYVRASGLTCLRAPGTPAPRGDRRHGSSRGAGARATRRAEFLRSRYGQAWPDQVICARA